MGVRTANHALHGQLSGHSLDRAVHVRTCLSAQMCRASSFLTKDEEAGSCKLGFLDSWKKLRQHTYFLQNGHPALPLVGRSSWFTCSCNSKIASSFTNGDCARLRRIEDLIPLEPRLCIYLSRGRRAESAATVPIFVIVLEFCKLLKSNCIIFSWSTRDSLFHVGNSCRLNFLHAKISTVRAADDFRCRFRGLSL